MCESLLNFCTNMAAQMVLLGYYNAVMVRKGTPSSYPTEYPWRELRLLRWSLFVRFSLFNFAVSRQFCANCIGFLFRDVSTSNGRALSSRLCLVMHLRTWLMIYFWFLKDPDDGYAPSSSTDRSCVVPRMIQQFQAWTQSVLVLIASGAQCDCLLNCAI